MEILKTSLVISVNTSIEIRGSWNESCIIYDAIKSVILLIATNMGVEAQFNFYSNRSTSSDIAINLNDGGIVAESDFQRFFLNSFKFQMKILFRCGLFIRIGTVSSTQIQRNLLFIDHS